MQKKNVYGLLKVFCLWVIPFLVVSVFGTWYLFQRIKQEKVALEEKKAYNEETLKQLESFEKIKSDLKGIKETKDLFQKTLIGSGETLALIKELEEGAEYAGVELRTGIGEKPQTKKTGAKNLSADKEDKGKDEVWLKLEVEGNFFNVLKFIRFVENSSRTIGVATLSLAKSIQITKAEMASIEEIKDENREVKAIVLVSNN